MFTSKFQKRRCIFYDSRLGSRYEIVLTVVLTKKAAVEIVLVTTIFVTPTVAAKTRTFIPILITFLKRKFKKF